MNRISLKKVTLIVSTCALASYFVAAEEKLVNLDSSIVKDTSSKAVSKNNVSISVKEISGLLTKYDSDKNGLLNEAEVVESKNELLTKHFKDIDQNSDTVINQDELNSYFLL